MIPNYEDIESALKAQEFHLVYQPKYDISTNHIVGLEALVRWQSGLEKKLLYPGEFIPLAEKLNIITEITMFVLHEVCRFICEYKTMIPQCVPISINISRIDLCKPFFACLFISILKEYGIDPCDIEVEITETAFVYSQEEILQQVNQLRQYGIRIAIDDFGTGYSNLSFLKNIPADILKIDKEFMKNISTDKQGQCFLRSILMLARDLELDLIVEGIETKEDADYMKSQGCKLVQGYYFSKPVSQENILRLLSKKCKLLL